MNSSATGLTCHGMQPDCHMFGICRSTAGGLFLKTQQCVLYTICKDIVVRHRPACLLKWVVCAVRLHILFGFTLALDIASELLDFGLRGLLLSFQDSAN